MNEKLYGKNEYKSIKKPSFIYSITNFNIYLTYSNYFIKNS